jgi:hypothetical protein
LSPLRRGMSCTSATRIFANQIISEPSFCGGDQAGSD